MKTADEIRDFLLERLRLCLFRPGICGGELGILNLFEYITFIEERRERWLQHRRALHQSKGFNSRGVTGAFEQLHHTSRIHQHDDETASVYARIAVAMGYLTVAAECDSKYVLQRILSAKEFDAMLAQLHQHDQPPNWIPEEVTARFGEPAIRWGQNDYYPCTLMYLVADQPERFIYFDFWAEWFKDETGVRVPCKYGPKPILRNVRVPAATFPEQFRFSRFGNELRDSAAEDRKQK